MSRAKRQPKPPLRAADPPPAPSAAAHVIATGGAAARAVYQTPELRSHIWSLLDSRTMVGVFRLEKAVTASVADVVYKEVHVSMMSKMSRSGSRRKTYCDAVRILDISPLPTIGYLPDSSEERKRSRPGKPFDPAKLLRNLAVWRKKYPRLAKVTYHFPADDADDAYVVHIRDDDLLVKVEKRVHFDAEHAPPDLGAARFPPTPVHPGMTIELTFVVKLSWSQHADRLWPYDHELAGYKATWRALLFDNPNIDRRVVGLDQTVIYDLMSSADAIAFLEMRRQNQCEPMTWFRIHAPQDVWSTETWRDFAVALGPNIRTLHVNIAPCISFAKLRSVVEILDEHLPFLSQFTINYDYCSKPSSSFNRGYRPLEGLPRLRTLAFLGRPMFLLPDQVTRVAQSMCRLGSSTTFFQYLHRTAKRHILEFDATVKKFKKDSASLVIPKARPRKR